MVNSTLIEEIIGKTYVVFLGFSHFKLFSSYFSFYTYFAPINNTIISKKLNFPIIISYETNMRVLKETEGDCTLNEIITPLNYQYSCEVHEDTSNIKSISVQPDFIFLSQKDIDVIGITPLAKMFMNNLLMCDERFDKISNSTIYLMDDSTYEKYDRLLFNITGAINGTQPKFENKTLNVMINLKSDEKIKADIICDINELDRKNNYLLNCEANETLESDLQSAISFIDNSNILLINFANHTNSIINIGNKITYNRLFYKNRTGLSPGAIAALIIALVVALASFIFIDLYFRKKNVPKKMHYQSNSAIMKINN